MSNKTTKYDENTSEHMVKAASPYEVYQKFMSLPLDKRVREVENLTKRYPSKIGVIVHTKNKQAPLLKKCKFLVDKSISVSEFMFILRKYMELKENESIFLFTEANTLPPSSSNFGSLYEQHKHKDGFLYLEYNIENTFG
jgi:GABA(A) receptor-associated protein